MADPNTSGNSTDLTSLTSDFEKEPADLSRVDYLVEALKDRPADARTEWLHQTQAALALYPANLVLLGRRLLNSSFPGSELLGSRLIGSAIREYALDDPIAAEHLLQTWDLD